MFVLPPWNHQPVGFECGVDPESTLVCQLRQAKVSDGRIEKPISSVPSSSERSIMVYSTSLGISQQSRPTLRPRTKTVNSDKLEVTALNPDRCWWIQHLYSSMQLLSYIERLSDEIISACKIIISVFLRIRRILREQLWRERDQGQRKEVDLKNAVQTYHRTIIRENPMRWMSTYHQMQEDVQKFERIWTQRWRLLSARKILKSYENLSVCCMNRRWAYNVITWRTSSLCPEVVVKSYSYKSSCLGAGYDLRECETWRRCCAPSKQQSS